VELNVDAKPLQQLYEAEGLPAFALPGALSSRYGPLGFPNDCLYANFVASLDGVTAIPDELQSSHLLAGQSEGDRFVLGLLRACADAILIGSGTLRDSPTTQWTPSHAHPPAATAYAELRRLRGSAPQPELAVLSGSGRIDTGHPGLREHAVVLTSDSGAAHLEGSLPASAEICALGPGPRLDVARAVDALRSRGHRLILCEGGPTVLGQLVAAGLVDEIFLTISPLLAGRDGEKRLSLIEGRELLPDHAVRGTLLSLHAQGSHLFLRYALAAQEDAR
jgi:riboflavin biosynthesis pyrimidine reductase